MESRLSAFLASWSLEPQLLAGFILAAALYGIGWRHLRLRASGGGRPAAWRIWCYGLGLAMLAVALISPIAVFGSLLFSLHMVQHILLTLVVPPLVLLGAPLLPCLWGLPREPRHAVGRLLRPTGPLHGVLHVLTHPLIAAPLFFATTAIWHVPSFYDAAQGRTAVHDVQHLLFIGTAFLYWWPVIHPIGGRRRLGHGAAVLYLFVATIEGTVIGALLTFARRPLYATYQQVPRVWGLSTLEDQQLAGLIMWIPGGLLLQVAALASLIIFLAESKQNVKQAAQRGARSPATLLTLAASVIAALLWVSPASANGGTIQISMERAGPYEVTVFTDPSPIRVGTVDVSTMVERPGGELVQDARVMVTATPVGDPGAGGTYEATHDLATNKLFYAAHVPISRAGPWRIDVTVTGAPGEGTVGFEVEASEASITDRLPLLVLVLIMAGLVVAAGVARYRSSWKQQPTSL